MTVRRRQPCRDSTYALRLPLESQRLSSRGDPFRPMSRECGNAADTAVLPKVDSSHSKKAIGPVHVAPVRLSVMAVVIRASRTTVYSHPPVASVVISGLTILR
jgi:hypothetical protein